MERKAVSGIMLILLLVGMLTLAFNIQPVKSDWVWTETIYIRADGSVDPPTAPISSVDNITYTLADNIVGDVPEWLNAIVVERDDIVIDGAWYTVQGTGTGIGIDLTRRSNVTIKDIKITAFVYGIYLYESSNNSICENNITKNTGIGIYLWDSTNNSILGNNITNNGDGIFLIFSSNNVLRNNSIAGNGYNFVVLGSELSHFIHDVDSFNNVEGKPMYYWISKRDMTAPLDAGYVALINCTRITVQNLPLTNNGQGVLLAYTTNSTITKNNITNNLVGIYLWDSTNNSILGNNITNNGYGIQLDSSSNHNSIAGNNIADNALGILLWGSSNNSIAGNNIANKEFGISLYESSNNSIAGNMFTNNGLVVEDSYGNVVEHNSVNGKPLVYLEGVSSFKIENAGQVILINCDSIRVENLNLSRASIGIQLWNTKNIKIAGNNITNNIYGILLFYSSNNSIAGNNIANNWDCIWLLYSSNNKIFHNNFVNNNRQVYSYDSVNVWDDGYPSGGNYWSDYTDIDLCSGPYQNETGSDGIWDHPYVIDVDNQDRYPLVNPWTLLPIGKFKEGDIVRAINDLHRRNDEGEVIDVIPKGYIGVIRGPSKILEIDGKKYTFWKVVWTNKTNRDPLVPEKEGWSAEDWMLDIKDNVGWLSTVIASEAGSIYDKYLGKEVQFTSVERAGVGYTVLNRLGTDIYGSKYIPRTVEEVIFPLDKRYAPQFGYGKTPPLEIKELARGLLEGRIVDPTNGATHFVSPISMPKEGEPTKGFDVKGGLHYVPPPSNIPARAYFPGWAAKPHKITECRGVYSECKSDTHTWTGNLENVRNDYFMFYRQNTLKTIVKIQSPAEIRVYDYEGRVTGLINGRIMDEIPGSEYYDDTITIFYPSGSYQYEVFGISEGSYGLTVTAVARQENISFSAMDIPLSPEAIHRYDIDWEALSLGEEGVTVRIDSDGDGTFEQTVIADGELTRDEFLLHLADVNDDGIVNIVDGVVIGVAFGSRPGDPNWNPIADIVPDKLINIQDIVLWAIHFGETW